MWSSLVKIIPAETINGIILRTSEKTQTELHNILKTIKKPGRIWNTII